MRDVDVVYCVELAARELDVACAVKHVAERRHGLAVEVLPVQTARAWAARHLRRPRLLALPYAYRVTDPYARQMVELFPGVKVLNLAWEQVLYRAFEKEKTPSDAFTREYVMHHAWSTRHRDRLVKAGVPDSHVFVNGQPAYMLYAPPYRERRPAREQLAREHGLDPGRPWHLFSENYGWAFNPPEKVEALVRSGIARETVEALAAFCDRSLREVLRWLAGLAAQGTEVVVRPRPSTPLPAYQRFVAETLGRVPERLRIIKDRPVRDWILSSDVVSSSYSTTLIEAALAGKPSLMLLPEPLPEGLTSDWCDLAPRIRDGEALLEADRAADPARGHDLAEWARRDLLGGADPIEGLADLLARLADPAFPTPPLPPRDVFPRKHRGWRALPQPGDGPADLAGRLYQRGRFALRRRRDAQKAPADAAGYRLEGDHVPERLRKWVERTDLFDSRDVDRIAGEWRQLLG